MQVERLVVGDDFNPEVGFLLRDEFERSFGMFRFSPRPAGIAAIRKLTWQGQLDYITTREDVLETRQAAGALWHRIREQRSVRGDVHAPATSFSTNLFPSHRG